ncbi:MAG: EamA family transporter, partial [Candidatus Dormibacteraeota bacterium]|nr:EamA family transporter [Candidatus Dormibacteraeota bacterium]
MTRRGWLLFAAMGVIWGVPYLLIKVAVADLSPASLVLLRTATGALVLLPIAAARGSIAPL